MSANKSSEPRIVGFFCENSACQAADMIPELPGNPRILRVPCAGKVDELYIMRALEEGADGVVVVGCFTEACRYIRGNIRAEKRLERVRAMLEELEMEPSRVQYWEVTGNQDGRLKRLFREFVSEVSELPHNPGYARKAVKS